MNRFRFCRSIQTYWSIMKALIPVLCLSLPSFAQAPVDASHPGLPLRASEASSMLLGGAGSAADDFNRPDSASMGADWTERSGDLLIANNAGHGTSSVSWMTHNTLGADYADSVQQVDFLPQATGAGAIYVALTVGSATNATENVFAKVQDNTGDGIYDRVFFYKGINGSPWAATYYFDLAVPTAAGRMQLSFLSAGDLAVLDIDRDSDGNWDEQFQAPGILASFTSVGSDYGISTYQNPSFDNWNVNGGAPGTGFCYANTASGCPCGNSVTEESGCSNNSGLGAIMTGSGSATVGSDTLVLSVTQAAANSPGLFFSGPGTIAPSFFGDGLRCVSGPILRLGVVFADASGSAATNFSISLAEGLTGGETRSYQYWYRDTTGPCGTGFNTSNGYGIQW